MNFSRNKVFSDGLKKSGVRIVECVTTKTGFSKLIDLYKKHKKVKDTYDILIAGYPGYTAVPYARLLTRKKVILDALASRYDSEIISRNNHKGSYIKKMWILFIDWIAFAFAHLILVETHAQKEFISRKFKISEKKIIVAYTGVNEDVFKKDVSISKHEKFTALFRGRVMSEAGVQTILKAAEILKDKDANFDIIGYGSGPWLQECRDMYHRLDHNKVKWDEKELPFEEIVIRMQKAHISLGQFATSERVERTIPHKAFESMILCTPYITAQSRAVSEILEDGTACIMIDAENPQALAEAIMDLRNNESKRNMLATQAETAYWQHYSMEKIGSKLKSDIEELIK